MTDAGSGVSAEERERIFDPFVQGARATSGRGLGLAFCKLAAEAHGGRVGVDSGSAGASFWIELPKHAEGETPGGAS